MARVFLDTNIFIDAIHRRPEKQIQQSLLGHISYLSPFSIGIYCYLYKVKIPNKILSAQVKKFHLVELSDAICEKALGGPTDDFEDNIQLHSAVEADCDVFLTADKKLLQMKFFGKTKIASDMASR